MSTTCTSLFLREMASAGIANAYAAGKVGPDADSLRQTTANTFSNVPRSVIEEQLALLPAEVRNSGDGEAIGIAIAAALEEQFPVVLEQVMSEMAKSSVMRPVLFDLHQRARRRADRQPTRRAIRVVRTVARRPRTRARHRRTTRTARKAPAASSDGPSPSDPPQSEGLAPQLSESDNSPRPEVLS
jgi:hypothetical protein